MSVHPNMRHLDMRHLDMRHPDMRHLDMRHPDMRQYRIGVLYKELHSDEVKNAESITDNI
jgi:hypothetical protein